MHYKVSKKKERERERSQNCIWWNCGWKLPKSKEGKTYLGTGSTENTKQDEPKEIQAKVYHN